MIHATIALIDESGTIQPSHLAHTAAAIQTQVIRDLAPHWGVSATITTLPQGSKLPSSVWGVYVKASLPPGEGGYHWTTGSKQPYADILAGAGWTVDASHEILEMLIDPFGNRLQSAPGMVISDNQEQLSGPAVSYLVEVCDPCEAITYDIGNVPVSDFILPAFYVIGTGGQYSFTGAIKRPLQVLPGGYISWMTEADEMMQLLWLEANPSIVDLGSAQGKASLRGMADGARAHPRVRAAWQDAALAAP